jgi:alkaline phosphatase D
LYDENGSPPEDFEKRRAAAYQAYYEHMPIRVAPPDDANLPIYRSVAWGGLADILVLDTRQYRSDQVCGIEALGGDVGDACEAQQADSHVLLGREQEDWLLESLLESDATWKVLANQMVFAHMPIGTVFNNDQWDGYPNDRLRLLHLLTKSQIENVVVVTGDIHSSGAAEVYEDPENLDAGPVAVEFVGTSISSGSSEQLATVAGVIEELPWVEFVDVVHRGYGLVTVTPTELRADFRYVETALEPTSALAETRSFTVAAGTSRLEPVTT